MGREEYKISPDTVYWSVVLLAILIGFSRGYQVGVTKGHDLGWRDGVRDEKIGTMEELTPLRKDNDHGEEG